MVKEYKINVVDVGINENISCHYPDFGAQVASQV
jgi:ribose 5-phosphate isomerase RpiB